MTLISIVGIAASVLTATSLIPQLLKIIKEKKAENVSLGMLLILFGGLALWVYYGFLRKDLIIIISNSFSFMVNLVLAILALKYKGKAK
jgi:MtN3 and saliva related transmembrane protein